MKAGAGKSQKRGAIKQGSVGSIKRQRQEDLNGQLTSDGAVNAVNKKHFKADGK